MRIRGAIEQKSAHSIIGWLAVTEGGEGAPTIEVLYHGKVIGAVTANELRADVRAAGFGDGYCGFVFRMPPNLGSAETGEIELRVQGTEIYLDQALGMPSLNAEPYQGKGSVFILGPARSGTSVMFLALQNVLNLSGLGESHVPQIFQKLLYEFYEYKQRFSDKEGVLAQRLSVPDFRENIILYVRRFYYDQFKTSPFVDKTPGLEAITGAPFLRDVFPEAKIIIMKRNGIETIESYRRKFGASFQDALNEWAACASETAKLKRNMEDVLIVSQHDIRRNARQVAKLVCRFLGDESKNEELALFFRDSHEDVTSATRNWDIELTLDQVPWSTEEKAAFTQACLHI